MSLISSEAIVSSDAIETDAPIVSDRRDESTTRNDADVTVTADGLTVTDATADEVASHETILADGRKMSVKGKFRKLSIDQLWRSDNPRELYELDELVQSIRLHGFRQNEPIMVVAKVNPDNPDQLFLVVRGNRRIGSMLTIRDDYPDDFKIISPDGKVPCIAYTGCSNQEIAMLRMDFDTRAGKRDLDGWEEFLAVRLLTREGIHTESAIAQLLGMVKTEADGSVVPNRSYVQNRVRLSRMPVVVQNLFKPVLRGRTKETVLRVGDIAKLATAFRAGKDNPDSPIFREKLDSLVNRPAPGGADSDDSVTPVSHKDLKDRVNSMASPVMRRVLSVIIFGEGTDTLASLDDLLVRHLPSIADVPELSDVTSDLTVPTDTVVTADDGSDSADCPKGWDKVEGDDSAEG